MVVILMQWVIKINEEFIFQFTQFIEITVMTFKLR